MLYKIPLVRPLLLWGVFAARPLKLSERALDDKPTGHSNFHGQCPFSCMASSTCPVFSSSRVKIPSALETPFCSAGWEDAPAA